MSISATAALISVFLLAGCQGEVAENRAPQAVAPTQDAVGYYCQMEILAHDGPKAQIHLSGTKEPLWFAQVRDGIAYYKSPDEPAGIASFYVNDMGAAKSWAQPGPDNWIAAREAYYVVGSAARGGMGAPEIVPFSTKSSAESFAAKKGGKVMRLPEIPTAAVLSPVQTEGMETGGMQMDHAGDGMKDGMKENQ